MMLAFRRIDTDLLFPAFREEVEKVIKACDARGCIYVATRGFDTYGAQNALHAQGRTKPGPIVTNAVGGQSAHNFGLACDFVRDINAKQAGVQPSWKESDYEVLIEEALNAGLHSGRTYKDFPHVSWPGYVSAADLKLLDEVWQKTDPTLGTVDRLKLVWQHVRL